MTYNALEMFDLGQKVMEFEVMGTYKPELKVGDWVSRSISIFFPISTLKLAQHHGVVCGFDGDGEPLIVQLNVSYFPHFCIGIKTSKFKDFLNSDKVFRLYDRSTHPAYAEATLKPRIDEIVESGVYYNTYNLLWRNCEHFATQLLTGKPVSYETMLLEHVKRCCRDHRLIECECKGSLADKVSFVKETLKTIDYPKFIRCKW